MYVPVYVNVPDARYTKRPLEVPVLCMQRLAKLLIVNTLQVKFNRSRLSCLASWF